MTDPEPSEWVTALIGRTVVDVQEEADDGLDHPTLTLDNGQRIQFQGLGYDGLWTEVFGTVLPEKG